MPSGITLALYALTVVCAVALVTIWILMNRGRRNAGFASKRQLKRQMSAEAVLRATEIRPSLTREGGQTVCAWAVSLSKDRSVGR